MGVWEFGSLGVWEFGVWSLEFGVGVWSLEFGIRGIRGISMSFDFYEF